MRKINLLITFLFLVSCSNSNHRSLPLESRPLVDTSELTRPIKLNFKLPDNCKLDSLKYYDKKRNAIIIIALPLSGVLKVDTEINSQIMNQRDSLLSDIDGFIKQDSDFVNSALTSEFTAIPISVFEDSKIISYSFVVYSYFSGGAHPVMMFYSYNYDILNQKHLNFDDFFILKSKSDTTYFTDLITKAIDKEGIVMTRIKNQDFNIEKDTISFNFGDYEIGGYADGIMQGRIKKSILNDKIIKSYH
jgi:hypothetical protein